MALLPLRPKPTSSVVNERIDKLEARDKRSRVRADFALRRAYELMDDRMKHSQ